MVQVRHVYMKKIAAGGNLFPCTGQKKKLFISKFVIDKGIMSPYTKFPALICSLDCLQQQHPKYNINPFEIWVVLHAKDLIFVFGLPRENAHIWVMPLMPPKIDLMYRCSVGDYIGTSLDIHVGDYRYFIGYPFRVWVFPIGLSLEILSHKLFILYLS